MADIDSQLTGIKKDIDYLVKKTDRVESLLEKEYITNDQHLLLVQRVDVIQKIVWGAVSLILVAVIGALINLVINNGRL